MEITLTIEMPEDSEQAGEVYALMELYDFTARGWIDATRTQWVGSQANMMHVVKPLVLAGLAIEMSRAS